MLRSYLIKPRKNGLLLSVRKNPLGLWSKASPFHDGNAPVRSDKLLDELDHIFFIDPLMEKDLRGKRILCMQKSQKKMLRPDIIVLQAL